MRIVMLELLEKLSQLEQEFACTYGPFSLFALMQREEANDRWDLVVSAPWLEQVDTASTSEIYARYIRIRRPKHDALFSKLQRTLTPDELVMLSRVVTPAPETNFVRTMNELYHFEHERREIAYLEVDNIEYRRGYVITSQSIATLEPQQYAASGL